MKKLDFTREEAQRRQYIKRIEALSSPDFDPDRWEELRKTVYKTSPLNVDVIVDDTTLREGLQMAELVSPKPEDMCRIACLLRDIGVEREEVIAYAKSDQKALRLMQKEGLGDMLAAWCRAVRKDVDLALKMDFGQVGISHPVSYIHFQKWPQTSLEQLVERVVNTVEYAVDHGLRVFVHGEDSTRAEWAFERKFINAVAEAGAEVYRICDTVGCGSSDSRAPLPHGIPRKIQRIKKETTISYVEIHAHDDLGNAVENTLTAIEAADGLYDKFYASTTFLGIGDRSGNAETEKIMLNCYFRHNIYKWNLKPLKETASFIASALNYYLPVNKAIIGVAAFSHESGIHLHGIRALPLTYEVVPPELVGHERAIIVGKRSGRHGIQMKLEEFLGERVEAKDPRLQKLVRMIQDYYVNGDRRRPVSDSEFKELSEKAGFHVEKK